MEESKSFIREKELKEEVKVEDKIIPMSPR